MNELSRLAFVFSVNLFQSILFVRFACSCLHFREKTRHPAWLSILAVSILFIFLTAIDLFPVFSGLPLFVSGLLLLLFAAKALEGSIPVKVLVSVLPGIAAAAGNILASGFFLLLMPNSDTKILTALLANGILFAICRKAQAVLTRQPAELTDAQRPALYVQLSFSAVLFLLLYYGESVSHSRAVKLLLCAGILVLVLWDFAVYRLLVITQKKNRAELESCLLKQEKANQLRIDELNYQYESLQKVRHDFKNTLTVLQSLNAQRKPAQIDAYINDYLDTTHTSAAFVSSENEYANAIINAKTQEARSHGIDVKIVITSPIVSNDPVDICNVLGNLFDNAIAACLKATESPRISLHIYDQGDETIFCMKNSIAHSVLEYNPELKTSKEDKRSHGYGTQIIREIAAKHQGFADFYEENSEFCCNVVMYL